MCHREIYFAAVTLSLLSVALGIDEIDAIYDENIKAEERTLPDDLVQLLKAKSAQDRMMEECMKEYIECSRYRLKDVVVCAESEDKKLRFFESMCEMFYENCKLNKNTWFYLNDKICKSLLK